MEFKILEDEVKEAIRNINNEIDEMLYASNLEMEDYSGYIYLQFQSSCNGFISVDYLGCNLWYSENDCREYIGDSSELEPIEGFIRKEMDKVITIIKVSNGEKVVYGINKTYN